jgi:hypothetical protein
MPKEPIMSQANERFLAFEGLLQWLSAVVRQGDRIATEKRRLARLECMTFSERRQAGFSSQTENHFFAIAAYKVMEHRDWVLDLGLLSPEDFRPIETFSRDDIRDLRDMREHIVDYFKGDGRKKDRWVKNNGDASTADNDIIGGRLNWVEFSAAAAKLLGGLISKPPFYSLT